MSDEEATEVVEDTPVSTEGGSAVEEITQEAPAVEAEVSDEPQAESDGEDTTEDKEVKRNSVQKRIKQLTSQKREMTEKLDAQERMLQQFRTQNQDEVALSRPNLEQFDYDEQRFNAAVDEYNQKSTQRTIHQALAEQQRYQTEAVRQESNRLAIEQFSEKSNEFAIEHADYFEKVQAPNFVAAFKSAPVLQKAALQTDNAPAVLYHLAQNPNLAQELRMSDEFTAAMQIGRISEKLGSPVVAKTNSNAPTPIRPVGNTASVNKDPSDMSPDEYARYRGYKK
tara:strand:- start:1000 stop:1845 length:846 start_codon:yes stop_codon:yes gene_type:complete